MLAKSFRKTPKMKGESGKFYIHRKIVLLATLIRGDGIKRDVENFLWNPAFPSDADIFLYCCSNLKLPNPLPNRRTFVALRSPCGIYVYPKCEEKCFITMGLCEREIRFIAALYEYHWEKKDVWYINATRLTFEPHPFDGKNERRKDSATLSDLLLCYPKPTKT